MSPPASRLARYAIAVGATATAIALRGIITPVWGLNLPLITFYPAIIVSAWFGGFWPGVLTTILSAVAAVSLFMPLIRSADLGDTAGLIVFLGIGFLINWLTDALRRTRERLAEKVRDLQHQAVIRERADEARAQLAAIVQHSDDAIISKTLKGEITSWNTAATRMFGYAPDEVIGRSITMIIPEDRLDEEAMVIAAIRRGEAIEHFETIRLRKDQTPIPISLTVSPVKNAAGEVIGASKIARDISARKAADDERAALLAREHAARRDAETANRAKDEFLAVLGHELRNPVAAISNAVYILERNGDPDDAAARARAVIARQVAHLGRLVDDLLDVGRVMSGKALLVLKSLDLREVAAHALDTLRESGKAERHLVTFDGVPALIEGDATRIDQIAVNLITNALKFTPPGGSIRVQVTQEAGTAVLRVADDGVGIAPALLPHIFELFVQGQAPIDRPEGGLGIGLTLVKQLAELHGGSVEARSDGPGRGATVTVRFPLIATPASELPRRAALSQAPRRILIVEDNADARETLRTMLEFWHHTVREAADGPSGIEAAQEFQPDIALIDVGLPGLDGYQVARHLRASGGAPGLRLIAITGYGLSKDALRAREAGFDAHLVKPVHPDRLAEILASQSG